jgi:hypothetical protein
VLVRHCTGMKMTTGAKKGGLLYYTLPLSLDIFKTLMQAEYHAVHALELLVTDVIQLFKLLYCLVEKHHRVLCFMEMEKLMLSS